MEEVNYFFTTDSGERLKRKRNAFLGNLPPPPTTTTMFTQTVKEKIEKVAKLLLERFNIQGHLDQTVEALFNGQPIDFLENLVLKRQLKDFRAFVQTTLIEVQQILNSNNNNNQIPNNNDNQIQPQTVVNLASKKTTSLLEKYSIASDLLIRRIVNNMLSNQDIDFGYASEDLYVSQVDSFEVELKQLISDVRATSAVVANITSFLQKWLIFTPELLNRIVEDIFSNNNNDFEYVSNDLTLNDAKVCDKEFLKLLEEQSVGCPSLSSTSSTSTTSTSTPIPLPPSPLLLSLEEIQKKQSEQIKLLPDCSERFLLQLCLKCSCQDYQVVDSNNNVLENPWESLKQHLQQEKLLESTQDKLCSSMNYYEQGHPEETQKELMKLLKKVRSLDIYEIQQLIQKSKNTANIIKNQDIVLVVGSTGSGKSTTLQFLAGGTMVEEKIEIEKGKYLDHIHAVKPYPNPALEGIVSSPFSKSETRSIFPILVKTDDEDLWLVDAPGFGDTAGAEVDIVNSIGVFNALESCNSVKLFVLCGYLDIGNKGQGITSLALMLGNMIPGISQHQRSIIYGFSKFPTGKDVNALMINIKKEARTEGRLSDLLDTVLSNMIEETEENPIYLVLLGDKKINRENLLRKLKNRPGIKYPTESFRFSFSENTNCKISDQISLIKMNVTNALPYFKFEFIKYQLENLKILLSLIKLPSISQTYNDLVGVVESTLSKMVDEKMNSLKNMLMKVDGIKDVGLTILEELFNIIRKSEILKEHLETKLISVSTLVHLVRQTLTSYETELFGEPLSSQYAMSQTSTEEALSKPQEGILNQTKDEFDNIEKVLLNPLVHCYFSNFCLLASKFEDFMQNYCVSCCCLLIRWKNMQNNFSVNLESNNWKEVSKLLSFMFKTESIYEQHLQQADNQFKIKVKNIQNLNSIVKYLQSFLGRFDSALKKEDEMLKNYVHVVISAKETPLLVDILTNHEDCLDNECKQRPCMPQQIFKEMINLANNHIEGIRKKIEENISLSAYDLEDIKKMVDGIEKIRDTHPDLKEFTSTQFHKTQQYIANAVQQQKTKIQNAINSILCHSTKNYRQLSKQLIHFKKAQWVDTYNTGYHKSLMEQVSEELVNHAQNLFQKFELLDLTKKTVQKKNGDEIREAYTIVGELRSMQCLEESVPDISTIRQKVVGRDFMVNKIPKSDLVDEKNQMNKDQEVVSHTSERVMDFFTSINLVFDTITQSFNLEDKKVDYIKEEIRSREALQQEYERFSPSRQYLRKIGYDDFQSLTTKIKDVKTKNEKILEDIEKKLRSLEDNIDIKEKESHTRGKEIRNELSEMYQSSQNLISQFEKEKKKCQKEENELSELKNDYDLCLTKSWPKDSTKILEDNGFKTIDEIEQEIKKKKNIVIAFENNKQHYRFDKIDLEELEISLAYISVCSNVITVTNDRKKLNETSTQLDKFIKEYKNFIHCEILKGFKELKEPESKEREYWSNSVYLIQYIFAQKDRYPQLWKLPHFISLYSTWVDTFSEYLGELNNQVTEAREKNEGNLNLYLNIAFSISAIERLFGIQGNTYISLYQRTKQEISGDHNKSYKDVLSYIENFDFASADLQLSNIDLNSKSLTQIQLDLERAIRKLMSEANNAIIFLKFDGSQESLQNVSLISGNLEKINIVLSKTTLIEMLKKNVEFHKTLMGFEGKIEKELSEAVSKSLNSISLLLNNNNFFQAERMMTGTTMVLKRLQEVKINDKTLQLHEKTQKEMDEVGNKLSSGTDFDEVEKYSTKRPKEFLNKLKAVSETSPTYEMVYQKIFEKVRNVFSEEIEKLNGKTLCLEEKKKKIFRLKYSLTFLPDELEKSFKQQIDDFMVIISGEHKQHQDQVQKTIENLDNMSNGMDSVNKLLHDFEESNPEWKENLIKELIKKTDTWKQSLNESLLKEDLNSMIIDFSRIYSCAKEFNHTIPEISKTYQYSKYLIIKHFEDNLKILESLPLLEDTKSSEMAFNKIIIYFERLKEQFFEESKDQIKRSFNIVIEMKKKIDLKHRESFKKNDLDAMEENLQLAKKWDPFFTNFKKSKILFYLKNLDLMQPLDFKPSSFEELLKDFEKYISDTMKQFIEIDFLSNEICMYEESRKKFFQEMALFVEFLEKAQKRLCTIVPPTLVEWQAVVSEFNEKIKKKIKDIGQKALDLTQRQVRLKPEEWDKYRRMYQILYSFDEDVKIPNVEGMKMAIQSMDNIMKLIDKRKENIIKSITNLNVVSNELIEMKYLSENVSMFKIDINKQIDESLITFWKNKGSLSDLSLELQQADSALAISLMSEHKILQCEDCKRRREKMKFQDDVDRMLEKIKGDDLSKEKLRSRYHKFRKTYDTLLENSLKNRNLEEVIPSLVAETKNQIYKNCKREDFWRKSSFFSDLPEVLAYIFTVWTLQSTDSYNEARGNEDYKYLLMPHVGQLMAIFRILGLGFKDEPWSVLGISIVGFPVVKLLNSLVEVGTGEGKSVILAIISCMFALTDMEVSCSCYSAYLSNRDQNVFKQLFQAFGVESYILYGTFNQLCETFLNNQCNVREVLKIMIEMNKPLKNLNAMKPKKNKNKVLLIDEADVFLSSNFYGQVYNPVVCVKSEEIFSLLELVWKNRHKYRGASLQQFVKKSKIYENSQVKYSNWMFLLDEALKDMILAIDSFHSSAYEVKNDKIVYIYGESLVENIVKGYDTIWAYFAENEKGQISESSLKENVGVLVNCGLFSYAEMPLAFNIISGVSGTLATLSDQEKKILKETYQIHKMTFLPSVFGDCLRNFDSDPEKYILIEWNQDDHYRAIRNDIDLQCKAKRAVLVFFETIQKLEEFSTSSFFKDIFNSPEVQVINEKVSSLERELFVKRAASEGKITLITRTFGRGTDFECRYPTVLAHGGIHVIQTFFSEELSEEYQIKGRCARQGDPGSFKLILLASTLEPFLGPRWNEELKKPGVFPYSLLNIKRTEKYNSICESRGLSIEQCKKEHEASKNFMDALMKGNEEIIKSFLIERNKGPLLGSTGSRTLLLMDATGSMSTLLNAVKDTVCTMYEYTSESLKEKGIPENNFQMKFVAYRDYDCKERIMEFSNWETKALNLRSFMGRIVAEGGDDYEEAIEIALLQAVKESDTTEGISQVLLIADAPAKNPIAIQRDRNSNGGEHYWQTKYGPPTYYKTQINKLIEKGIPVHTFYLHKGAKANFEEMARLTGGRCRSLNMREKNAVQLLTTFVTEEVLRKSGENKAQGEELVQIFRSKHPSFVS